MAQEGLVELTEEITETMKYLMLLPPTHLLVLELDNILLISVYFFKAISKYLVLTKKFTNLFFLFFFLKF